MANWLVSEGYLQIVEQNGSRKAPTQKGLELGIFQEERTGARGHYFINLYPVRAQQLIRNHVCEILASQDEAL